MSNRRGLAVERDGQEYIVSAYASGSGALNFNATYAVDGHDTAQSINITADEVKEYRDKFMPGRLVVDEVYKNDNVNRWALVANVQRVDDDHLKLDGITYEIGESAGNEIAPNTFYINHEALGKNEVANLSTVSALNYYLKNEENIENSRDNFGNGNVIEKELYQGKDYAGPGMG